MTDVLAIEEILAGLWEQVLGRRPDPTSNFFDLGGDSMRAAKLTGQVKRALTKKVRMMLIFEQRRLSDYARAVHGLLAEDDGAVRDALLDEVREASAHDMRRS
ncbi:phosphopantetheine-binding protein [Kitasatospora sp. NPDC059747]|uniref:phosphopantetheine-binding protein n=1 Tax=Kitasatospora sp. NPDC059747 TaxID=3346930 RepID=UPI00365824A5